MEVSLVFVIICNSFIILIISIFGTRLLLKTYDHILDSQTHYDYDENEQIYESNEMFLEELRITARKFWISFYLLEFALILYFVFWGIMFYNKVKIV